MTSVSAPDDVDRAAYQKGLSRGLLFPILMIVGTSVGARAMGPEDRAPGNSRVITPDHGESLSSLASGYERIAEQFLVVRGRAVTGIGVTAVRAWAQSVPAGATVLDLGCGSGLPLTQVLIDEGLTVCGIDASPTLVAEFRTNLPGVTVACEAVEDASFFGRRFDAVLAWGLWFLLPEATQLDLLRRVADVLEPGGRLLFTAPAQACTWRDAMTGEESRSLGVQVYRTRLRELGFPVIREYDDEGENHYYDAVKEGHDPALV